MSQKFVPLHVYFNPERDTANLRWLEQQQSKSAAVREALRAYLQWQADDVASSEVTVLATVDADTIYQAVDEALAERLDLTAIRQVVEAAVGNALAGLTLTQVSEVEDEADDILSGLGSNRVIE